MYERILPITKAVLFPLIALTALSMLEEFYRKNDMGNDSLSLILFLAFILLNSALYAYLGIAVHRIVLMGSNSVPQWGIKGWTKREQSFFIYTLGFTILMLILVAASLITGHWIALIIALIIGFIVTARLSLIFPACAVDQPISLQESWDSTKNKTIFLVMILYIWPLVTLIPLFLIMWILSLIAGGIGTAISQVIYEIFSVVLIVIAVACLSIGYLQILKKSNV